MLARDPLHAALLVLCLSLGVFVPSLVARRSPDDPTENMMYAPPAWLIALGAVLTAAAAAVALYAWPWSRQPRRIVVGALAALIAFLIWRGALIIANGANLDIDYPLLLGLSFED